MKITSKTLLVNFETEVKLGNNDSIEMTLIHQAYISESTDGGVDVDLDLGMDTANVKFLGIKIEEGYKAYQEWKAQLLKLGIDVNKLIDEKEAQMLEEGIKEKLIEMFKGKF
jgi:hypothetical protein